MTDYWCAQLLDQLDFYWNAHFRPRMVGLTDEEYLWEPVDGAWSVRRRADGTIEAEQLRPDPPLPPVTTIAWRIVHIGRDIFGNRARALFGPSPAPDDADMYDNRHWPEPLPLTADAALQFLDQTFALWRDGVAALDDEDLRKPLGPKAVMYADDPVVGHVLHINREVMAHGAEICLLRDLYRAYRDREDPLLAACLTGDSATVRDLVGRDSSALARLRQQRPQLLGEVVGLHHWGALRTLIEYGFDVNSLVPGPLHYAAAVGDLDVVQYLVDHGADLTAVDDQFKATPAGWAEYFGHPDVAKYLAATAANAAHR